MRAWRPDLEQVRWGSQPFLAHGAGLVAANVFLATRCRMVFRRGRVAWLTMAEETRTPRLGLPDPLAVLRASRTFVGDLPGLAEQLTNSIGGLSDLIAEQLSATREQIAVTREQIAETRAMRAETVALRQELTRMRESFDQVRDKIPGL